MSAEGITFDFYTYGTTKAGCVVGRQYQDVQTGKWFRFCQAHTTLVGTALVAGNSATSANDPVVQVGTATYGLATDDVSAGLDATHPFFLGIPTSACPVSTATITYYFWAQTKGQFHTTLTGTTYGSITMNADDDAAIGHTVIMTANDAACDTVATGTAGYTQKAVGQVLVAVVAATNLVPGVLVNCQNP